MIAPDIGVADARLPRRELPAYRIDGRDLLVCGMMPDLEKPLTWSEGCAHFCAGTPILAELFAMLAPAIDAETGTILGSINPPSAFHMAGPIIQTRTGPRWFMGGVGATATSMKCIVVDHVPAAALRDPDGLDPRCHVDVDLDLLRSHEAATSMRPARRCVRIIPLPLAQRRLCAARTVIIDQ
jgi:hypothetical protein